MRITKEVSFVVDLKQPPVVPLLFKKLISQKKNSLVVFPDMHGNALLLLYRLMHCGIFDNKETDEIAIENDNNIRKKTIYESFAAIYYRHPTLIHALRNGDFYKKQEAKKALIEDIATFKKLLEKTDVLNSTLMVRLLGDLLADRGQNDYFTLLILQHLKKKGVPYEILFSNHDAGFLEALQKKTLRTPSKGEHYVSPLCSNSLDQLSELINNDIVLEKEITTLANDCYKPALTLTAYGYNEETNKPYFDTHAQVDPDIIKDLAEKFYVHYDSESFFETLHDINMKFKQAVNSDRLIPMLDEELALYKNRAETYETEKEKLKFCIAKICIQIFSRTKYSKEKTIERAEEMLQRLTI